MLLQDPEEENPSPRTVSLNTIRFCFADDAAREPCPGTTINISDTGMCFYTLNLLREGDKIIIKCDVPLPTRKAVVRWVKKFGNTLCKAGLMFIE